MPRELQFKTQRRKGGITLRGEWVKSTFQTERQKRYLTRAWTRRGTRFAKYFQDRKSYIKRRGQEVADRVKKNKVHIRRFRSHLLGKVKDFIFDDGQDDRGAEDSSAAGGETPSRGKSEAACEISDVQEARLYLQAVTVLSMVEEERIRDLLILEHTQASSDSLEAAFSAEKAMEQDAVVNLLSFGSTVSFC